MKLNQISIAGPFTHENLSIFLLSGNDELDGSRFMSLDEGLDQKCVLVHETGNVGQLEVENLSELFDLYVQAGDVVKGGRQDRTLGIDFVLPAKSGRVPVPSFCVESGRWHRRGGEEARVFSSSKSYLSSKKLRMAAKLSKSQGEVWASVAETQESLGASLGEPVLAAASPTSYQLSVENEALQKRKEGFRAALAGILADKPDTIGYAFAINGEINTADAYGSRLLFRKLWSKLLDAAILEAIAELGRPRKEEANSTTPEAVRQWFNQADEAEVADRQEVPPRVRVDTRRIGRTVVFDTRDHGLDDAVLRENVIAG
jgi:hypothetical protein